MQRCTRTVGLNPSLREARKRNRKLVAPLIAALLYLLPQAHPTLSYFLPLFSPSVPWGGWVTANLIERQINKEIYCHFGAPPS